MTTNEQHGRDTCYFCHHPDSAALEQHHVHPQRFGGPDDAENLVTVCANCHRKLESLYDDSFYAALGVEIDSDDDGGVESNDKEWMRTRKLNQIIRDAEDTYPNGAPLQVVYQRAADHGISREGVQYTIERLKQKGEVYRPTIENLRTVE